MTVEEWAAVAAWIAAGVAVASTAVTLWLQWWQRAQPEWGAMTTGVGRSVQVKMEALGRSPAAVGAELTNVGDGAAFDVRVTVDGMPCEVIELDTSTSSIRLMPGARFGVVLPKTRLDEEHQVVIAWTASPTRWGRRWEQSLPLSHEGFGVRLPAARAPRP